MLKKACKTQNAIWLSPNKLVFSHIFNEPCSDCGKKKMLLVAERNQPLRCFKCGRSIEDELCWYCWYGIDPKLLWRGDVRSCLLGKDCGWVKFCEDFVPGQTFGKNVRRDAGERVRKAEELISKARFECCSFCEFWNMKKVIKTFPDGERTIVVEDYDAAFCEIRGKPHDWKTPCPDYRLANNPKLRAEFFHQKQPLLKYIEKVKALEKQTT